MALETGDSIIMRRMSAAGVGIVGFGRIGAEHARWLAGGGSLRAGAAADATGARLAMARAAGLRGFETIAEMLADREVRAVVISTPTAMHFEHARAALDAGKHVMVEKPMAMNLPESRDLVALARSRG